MQLNRDLTACSNADEIVAKCSRHFDGFDMVNLVTALHRLARHLPGGSHIYK